MRENWLLIGDWSLPSAQFVRLHIQKKKQNCTEYQTLSNARQALLTEPRDYEFVVVLQSYPDEFPIQDIEQLIGMLPIARWIVCYGEWCESMGRTESFWPRGWCVPLREAIGRLDFERQQYHQGLPPLPPTASRDEAFAYQVAD